MDDLKLAELPVPHIYKDASVSNLTVVITDMDADRVAGLYLKDEDTGSLISLGGASHARKLAEALLIAADRVDRENDFPT